MKKHLRDAALAAALAIAPAAALAQAIGGSASITVTPTTGNVQFPASITSYPNVQLTYPPGAAGTEVFFALGGASVTATTSSPSLPGTGICLNVGPNGYVAAITAAGQATVRIKQLAYCPAR
jgi:hypothetical protein